MHRLLITIKGFLSLFEQGIHRLIQNGHLRRSLFFWSGSGFIVTVPSAMLIASWQDTALVFQILIVSLAWWLLISTFLIGGVPLLRAEPNSQLIDYYGVPNGLTALRAYSCLPLLLSAILTLPNNRGLAIWCVGGFIFSMLDIVDGWLARRIGPITDLGKALDPAIDCLFFSMVAVGGYTIGMIPIWLSLLMMIRFLGPLLVTPLVLLSGRRPQLVHTVWGRRSTSANGIVLFVLMWVRIFHGPINTFALALGLPLVGISLVFYFLGLIRIVYRAPVVNA